MNPTIFPILVAIHSGWLSSQNVAGLVSLPIEQHSMGETWVNFSEGGWVDYYQSRESLEWGAMTQSLYRVSPNIVLQGKVCYRNFTGQEMSGSVFIHPEDKPFDMVEYNAGRAGEKQLEEYSLDGGISYQLNKQWNLGAKLEYTAANYAKRKDLRHQNRLMQMKLSAGMQYHLGKYGSIGLSYLMDREVEGVSFNLAGTNDEDYYTLVSYGAFYGIKQLATSLDGYASTSNGMLPLVDCRQGGALQFSWDLKSGTKWYNEYTLLRRNGYYGRKSNYSVVYTDHTGQDQSWRTCVSKQSHPLKVNLWEIDVRWKKLVNSENLYNEQQQGGGLSQIVYHGQMERQNRHQMDTRLKYVHQRNRSANQLHWMWQAEIGYKTRDLRATFYPTYRDQKICQWQLSVMGTHQWQMRRSYLQLQCQCGYQDGAGTRADDGLFTTGSASTYAISVDRYLKHNFEYETQQQWEIIPEMKISYPLAKQHVTPYFILKYRRIQATKNTYINNNYNQWLQLLIGCTF